LIAFLIDLSCVNLTLFPDSVSKMSIRPLLKQEIPWLISELVLLIVLLNANPPELWFWFVVFLVIFGYRIERWWTSRTN
jgi:hypothetical protein